jgi:hypothetical protein
MTSRALILCLFGFAAVVPQRIAAEPVITFEMRLCGGEYAPCTVTGTNRTPTVQELAGLTVDAVRSQLFAWNGPDANYWWEVTDSNADGVIIGGLRGTNSVDTQFVYHNGVLHCCTTDHPFRITDINDNGLMIGILPQAPRQLGTPYYPSGGMPFGFIGFAPTSRAEPRHIAQIIFDPRIDPQSPLRFIGIDNNNNVLGGVGTGLYPSGQMFELTPTPEPESVVLFATVLAGYGLVHWRRRRSESRDINQS